MRLLFLDEHNEFCLTPDLRDQIPPYAILSHCWGLPEDEVTFADVNAKTVRQKKGLEKLLFCANCASSDGLEYFWIDTCCIDKSTATEVSRSITSMFKWYAEARHCYVFLEDVRTSADLAALAENLQSARWFTRGWTLQELLAANSVKFFGSDGTFLGHREELAARISEITGIDIRAMTGTPLHCFTDEERFRWAAGRSTTEPEDHAYSLLGIFGVTMLPHYGEGRENAFNRLKREVTTKHYHDLLKLDTETLCISSAAKAKQQTQPIALSHRPRPVSLTTQRLTRSDARETLPDTIDALMSDDRDQFKPLPRESSKLNVPNRVQLLSRREEILDVLKFDGMDARRSTITPALEHTCQWLLRHPMYRTWKSDEHALNFLWIKGHAGAGKSTLMKFADYHISAECDQYGGLLTSFYFNARGSELEQSVNGMYRSLIVQMMTGLPQLQTAFDELRFGRRGLPVPSFFNNPSTAVLKEIFSTAVDRLGKQIFCLIDALDETFQDDVHDMVQFLSQHRKIKVCFASRHYPALDLETSLKLNIDHDSGHKDDITTFIANRLRIGDGPKAETVRKDLLDKANGIFMWVVLVVTILNEEFRRGRIVLVQQRLRQIPPRLSELLKEISQQGDIEDDDFLLCLQWLLFSKRALGLEEFYAAMLLGLSESQDLTQDDLTEAPDRDQMENFMLTYSKGLAELTKAEPPSLQFIHESIREYLLNRGGLKDICADATIHTSAASHERLKICCYRSMIGASDADLKSSWPILLTPLFWTVRTAVKSDSIEERRLQRDRQRHTLLKIESAAKNMQNRLTEIAVSVLQRRRSDVKQLHRLLKLSKPTEVQRISKLFDLALDALHYLIVAIDEKLAIDEILVEFTIDLQVNARQDQRRSSDPNDTIERTAEQVFGTGGWASEWPIPARQHTSSNPPSPVDSIQLHIIADGSSKEYSGYSLDNSLPFFDYATTFVLHHADQAATEFPQHAFLAQFDVDRWTAAMEFAPALAKHRHQHLLARLASLGYCQLVQTLLDIDASHLERRERDGKTALTIATIAGHVEVVRILLQARADVHSKDEAGKTAKWYSNSEEIDRLLLIAAYGPEYVVGWQPPTM